MQVLALQACSSYSGDAVESKHFQHLIGKPDVDYAKHISSEAHPTGMQIDQRHPQTLLCTHEV